MELETVLKEYNFDLRKVTSRYDGRKVFDDFLTMSLTQFAFPGCKIGQELHANAVSDYNLQEKKELSRHFGSLFLIYQKMLSTKNWFDLFGNLFEDYFLNKKDASNKGQFFTPEPICDLMNAMVGHSDNSQTIGDMACGSGRNLLAHYGSNLNAGNWYVGDDIDFTCVKMTVLNFLLHGVRGEVRLHNSISEPNFAHYNFVVNENLHLGGLPVPHVKIYKDVTLATPEEPVKEEIPKEDKQQLVYQPKVGVQLTLF